ncbi:Discoidin domain-containing receptor 2, partial [Trachymyrmex cornetzi]
RLKSENLGGAWCPKNQITQEAREWLEIDLHTIHLITATATQGRFGNGVGVEFAEAYLLEYWRPRLGKWVRYRDIKGKEVIQGNTNTYLESKHELEPPLWASKIRFLPYSYHRRTVCMRVELYGCYWSDGVVSYSMPQGDKRSNGWEFFDATYDGHWDGELRRGLGQLTDGRTGPDNFKMYYDNDRAQGWVGWRNDSRGQPVEIKFEFDKVREFSAVHIYCNNEFTRGVQVFSQIDILFSIGGKYYTGEPITYTYMEDKIFETSRNVTIKLHHRVGKFVKLRLHFSDRWIMVSEVTFDSAISNATTALFPSGVNPVGNSATEYRTREDSEDVRPATKLLRRGFSFRTSYHLQLVSLRAPASYACLGHIAHGNFTPEEAPTTESPIQSDVFVEKNGAAEGELPVSTAKHDDPTYMAIVIGVLTAVILSLAVAIFLIVSRHRQRKCFASPMTGKAPSHLGSTCATVEKGAALMAYTLEDDERHAHLHTHLCTHSAYTHSNAAAPVPTAVHLHTSRQQSIRPDRNQYTIPFCARSSFAISSAAVYANGAVDTSYDYAVPELGTVPLLNQDAGVGRGATVSNATGDQDSFFSKSSRTKTEDKKEVLSALKRRLEQTSVPLFPRHRLRMLSKLAEGAFGTVYVAEAEGIPEYGTTTTLGKRLVAVKFLLPEASEKEKLDFQRDVRILAALEDRNIARVLGACYREEPYCVVMEYLEHGDLCQFLKTHITAEDAHSMPIGVKTLSFNCLIYMAAQIASGMRYLENLNFVHRDLATRNCLVGKAYHIKISDFGTDNELYACDYYKVDGTMPLPVRWMAWESIFLGKYTTKSDVWAFAVTLWEILNLGRRVPYEHLSDEEVVQSLRQLHHAADCSNANPEDSCKEDPRNGFDYLPRPTASSKDIYDLMLECWQREETERPTFREISLFLQRKNLGYAPTS